MRLAALWLVSAIVSHNADTAAAVVEGGLVPLIVSLVKVGHTPIPMHPSPPPHPNPNASIPTSTPQSQCIHPHLHTPIPTHPSPPPHPNPNASIPTSTPPPPTTRPLPMPLRTTNPITSAPRTRRSLHGGSRSRALALRASIPSALSMCYRRMALWTPSSLRSNIPTRCSAGTRAGRWRSQSSTRSSAWIGYPRVRGSIW